MVEYDRDFVAIFDKKFTDKERLDCLDRNGGRLIGNAVKAIAKSRDLLNRTAQTVAPPRRYEQR
jgi:hypothetical protein